MFHLAVCMGLLLIFFPHGHCQDATLYDDKYYGGDQYHVSVSNGTCINVLDFNDRTTAVKTNGCIRLWQDIDCWGRMVDIQPPGIDSLVQIDFNDKLTSVSNCKFNGNDAILYDDKYYGGKQYPIRASKGRCTNVLDFKERTTAVKTNKCIRLWKDYECYGRFVDIKPPGVDNLVKVDFNDKLTSVSDCELGPELNDDVDVSFTFNGANDLAEESEITKKVIREWFPFIQSNMWSPAYKPVRNIYIHYDIEDRGIWANYTSREIHMPIEYARNNTNGGGVWIHYMTYILQQNKGCPEWIPEGLAEYMRRWFYEPKSMNENLDNDYLGDWLLVYLNGVMNRPIIYHIQKACQSGTWTENFIKDLTGKDAQEWLKIMVNDEQFSFKRP